MASRAVVIGAGISGIAAAAALRETFDEVLMLERDVLPEAARPRRGVPQGGQLHNLLSRGHGHLDALLPGFRNALVRSGGVCANVASQTHVFELGIRMPESDLGMSLYSASRPVIEKVARDILLSSTNVDIREATSATAISVGVGNRVSGVDVESTHRREHIPAEVVVDASGAGTHAGPWLADCGADRPSMVTRRHDQWYVSTRFRRPDHWISRNDYWLTFPTTGIGTRGGLVSPIEDDEWYVSLSGRDDTEQPRNDDEFREYSLSLEDNAISELIADSVTCSSPATFRKNAAVWYRYDLMSDPIGGFVPIGDALATLNPLFGQGMSVAAWQAAELAIAFGKPDVDLGEITQEYLNRAAAACQAAWSLGDAIDGAVCQDDEGGIDSRRTRAFASLLEEDPELQRRYVSIWHLLEPASYLYEPALRTRLEERSCSLNP